MRVILLLVFVVGVAFPALGTAACPPEPPAQNGSTVKIKNSEGSGVHSSKDVWVQSGGSCSLDSNPTVTLNAYQNIFTSLGCDGTTEVIKSDTTWRQASSIPPNSSSAGFCGVGYDRDSGKDESPNSCPIDASTNDPFDAVSGQLQHLVPDLETQNPLVRLLRRYDSNSKYNLDIGSEWSTDLVLKAYSRWIVPEATGACDPSTSYYSFSIFGPEREVYYRTEVPDSFLTSSTCTLTSSDFYKLGTVEPTFSIVGSLYRSSEGYTAGSSSSGGCGGGGGGAGGDGGGSCGGYQASYQPPQAIDVVDIDALIPRMYLHMHRQPILTVRNGTNQFVEVRYDDGRIFGFDAGAIESSRQRSSYAQYVRDDFGNRANLVTDITTGHITRIYDPFACTGSYPWTGQSQCSAISFEYDAQGRMDVITSNDGRRVQYVWDDINGLTNQLVEVKYFTASNGTSTPDQNEVYSYTTQGPWANPSGNKYLMTYRKDRTGIDHFWSWSDESSNSFAQENAYRVVAAQTGRNSEAQINSVSMSQTPGYPIVFNSMVAGGSIGTGFEIRAYTPIHDNTREVIDRQKVALSTVQVIGGRCDGCAYNPVTYTTSFALRSYDPLNSVNLSAEVGGALKQGYGTRDIYYQDKTHEQRDKYDPHRRFGFREYAGVSYDYDWHPSGAQLPYEVEYTSELESNSAGRKVKIRYDYDTAIDAYPDTATNEAPGFALSQVFVDGYTRSIGGVLSSQTMRVAFMRDAQGRVTRRALFGSGAVPLEEYAFTYHGGTTQLHTISYPDGTQELRSNYTDLGDPQTISWPQSNYALTLTYDDWGNIKRELWTHLAQAIRAVSYDYNAASQLEQIRYETLTAGTSQLRGLRVTIAQRDSRNRPRVIVFGAEPDAQVAASDATDFVRLSYKNNDAIGHMDYFQKRGGIFIKRRETELSYNSLGLIQQIQRASGTPVEFNYDNDKQQLLGISGGGLDRSFGYYDSAAAANPNSVGRLENVGLGGLSYPYGYDSQGRIGQINRPTSASANYEYDDFGRLLAILEPERTIKMEYVAGRRGPSKSTYGASGVVLTTRNYVYEGTGRLQSILFNQVSPAASDRIDYVYGADGLSRTAMITSSRTKVTTVRDILGQVLSEETQINYDTPQTRVSYTYGFTYDSLGRPALQRYPMSGKNLFTLYGHGNVGPFGIQALQWDSEGVPSSLVLSVEQDAFGDVFAYDVPDTADDYNATVDLDGFLHEIALGGIAESYTYQDERLATRSQTGHQPTAYTYTAAGFLDTQVDGISQWDFGYNGHRRSTQKVANFDGNAYAEQAAFGLAYDGATDRLVHTTATGEPNRSANYTDDGALSHYVAYDVSKANAGSLFAVLPRTMDLTYTLDGRLKTATSTRGAVATTSTYRYDAFGRRVQKAVNGALGSSTVQYIHDHNGRLLGERVGYQVYEYVYLGSQIIARIDSSSLVALSTAQTVYNTTSNSVNVPSTGAVIPATGASPVIMQPAQYVLQFPSDKLEATRNWAFWVQSQYTSPLLSTPSLPAIGVGATALSLNFAVRPVGGDGDAVAVACSRASYDLQSSFELHLNAMMQALQGAYGMTVYILYGYENGLDNYTYLSVNGIVQGTQESERFTIGHVVDGVTVGETIHDRWGWTRLTNDRDFNLVWDRNASTFDLEVQENWLAGVGPSLNVSALAAHPTAGNAAKFRVCVGAQAANYVYGDAQNPETAMGIAVGRFENLWSNLPMVNGYNVNLSPFMRAQGSIVYDQHNDPAVGDPIGNQSVYFKEALGATFEPAKYVFADATFMELPQRNQYVSVVDTPVVDPANPGQTNNQRVTVVSGDAAPSGTGGDLVYHYLNDYMGKPIRVFVVNTGAQSLDTVWDVDYGPYGEIVNFITGEDFHQPVRNLGQYADSDSGLYYNWHRYLEPTTGQFVSPDSIVQISQGRYLGAAAQMPENHNVYGYAGNSPYLYFDPNGLFSMGPVVGGNAEAGYGPGIGNNLTYSPFGFYSDGDSAPWKSYGAVVPGDLKKKGNSVVGACAGAGGGFFVSNADKPEELMEWTETFNINTPLGSFQFGTAGDVWIASYMFGKGMGFSVSSYPTYTERR